MSDLQWLAIVIPVALALVGAIWALIRHGLQRMQETLTAHGERITALETDNRTIKPELVRLRDMRHDIIDQVSHSLATWYTSLVNEINKLK